jgi:light-regulated signal transduction histidine kinase (bacteriophytochrome)
VKELQVEEQIHGLRAQLEQRAREAECARADLEAFTYVVSHDLKEPLLGIETYATFLLEDYGEHFGEEGRQLGSTFRFTLEGQPPR